MYLVSEKSQGFVQHKFWYDRYKLNPKYCLFCKEKLNWEKRNNDFCNHSCSAKYNNMMRVKNNKKSKIICVCGNRKHHSSKKCKNCRNRERINKMFEKTLREYYLKGNSRIKYSSIRKWARRILEFNKIPRKCYICGFETVVECCHIKPIHKFGPGSLMKEVNGLENIIYLCPNHHKMFDKGYFCILKAQSFNG